MEKSKPRRRMMKTKLIITGMMRMLTMTCFWEKRRQLEETGGLRCPLWGNPTHESWGSLWIDDDINDDDDYMCAILYCIHIKQSWSIMTMMTATMMAALFQFMVLGLPGLPGLPIPPIWGNWEPQEPRGSQHSKQCWEPQVIPGAPNTHILRVLGAPGSLGSHAPLPSKCCFQVEGKGATDQNSEKWVLSE